MQQYMSASPSKNSVQRLKANVRATGTEQLVDPSAHARPRESSKTLPREGVIWQRSERSAHLPLRVKSWNARVDRDHVPEALR